MKSVILTTGFHPPWNQGEVVATRRFAELLSQVYDHVTIISAIGDVRGVEDGYKSEYNDIDILYVNTVKRLRYVASRIIDRFGNDFDLHVSNMSLFNIPRSILTKACRIYVYQYALKNIRALSTYLRLNSLLILSNLIKKLSIITTSPIVYEYMRRIHSPVIYVPMPIKVPAKIYNRVADPINIIYIGHPDLARFPIDKVFSVVKYLNKEFYQKFQFKIYLSMHRLKDYMGFFRVMKKLIAKYGLHDTIKVVVKNLSEDEKNQIYRLANICLYPAVAETAVDPPLTVLEAMSFGCCVISTNIQSIPHILSNGGGIIIRRENLSFTLYRSLRLLLQNPTLIERMSRKAYIYVCEHHDVSRLVNYMKRIVSTTGW